MKKLAMLALVCTVLFTSTLVKADSFKTVTLGADLNSTQKQKMLDYFNVTENEADIIEITNNEERQFLKGIASEQAIGKKAISSAYVEPLQEGSGLTVVTNNLTYVDESMLSNAMITAGIKDAKVIAAAPFKVSGTAALTGVMKAFEKATGETIDPNAKKAANEEIVITGDLGQKVGKEKASQFIGELKTEAIKLGNNLNEETAKNIIIQVAQKYDIQFTNQEIQYLVDWMEKIKNLDIKLGDIQEQLQNIHDTIQKGIEENRGFFEAIKEALNKFFSWLAGLFA